MQNIFFCSLKRTSLARFSPYCNRTFSGEKLTETVVITFRISYPSLRKVLNLMCGYLNKKASLKKLVSLLG
jgi:hypothetical protein